MSIDLESYFEREGRVASRYDGQLDPDFQAALAAHYGWHTEDECAFSHAIQLPDGRMIEGAWDLRGSEDAVLGGAELHGKRVLEFGPSSGWLTSHIAAHAHETVTLEIPMGGEQHIVPTFGLLSDGAEADVRLMMERFRRSWWFTKREVGFAATAVYGDLQAPPADLGRFDVSVFVTVLLRLPNPYMALQAAARITDDMIIVTEPVTEAVVPGSETSPIALFAPSIPPDDVNHWWHHSPAAICRMLVTLGFSDVAVTINAEPGVAPTLPLFTIVARRPRAAAPVAATHAASSVTEPGTAPAEPVTALAEPVTALAEPLTV